MKGRLNKRAILFGFVLKKISVSALGVFFVLMVILEESTITVDEAIANLKAFWEAACAAEYLLKELLKQTGVMP